MSEQTLLDPSAIAETQFGEPRVVEMGGDPGPEDWCWCTCACKNQSEKASNARLDSATMAVTRPLPLP